MGEGLNQWEGRALRGISKTVTSRGEVGANVSVRVLCAYFGMHT